jgi:hypothetical protein
MRFAAVRHKAIGAIRFFGKKDSPIRRVLLRADFNSFLRGH